VGAKLFLKNRKGLSEVASNILMLALIVVLMTALFGYTVDFARNYQMKQGSARLESLVIEDVWFRYDPYNPSDLNARNITVTLYNNGELNVVIDSVYVNDTLCTNVEFNPSNQTITVKNHGTLVIKDSHAVDWESSRPVKIKVVTERFYSIEGEYVAP